MVMEKFEQQFEDLDVQAQYMEGSMGKTTTLSTPHDQVEQLMMAVAEEHGLGKYPCLLMVQICVDILLELNMEMGVAPTGVASSSAVQEPNDLSNRLQKLRNP